MSRKVATFPWMLLLILMFVSALAFGQNTASIKGTVTDASGAAVPGATVTVKNADLGIERTTQSNSAGDYEVPALPPATYSVQVQSKGFETQIAKNVVLAVSKNSVQNFNLKVASTSEVISVEATAPIIETTTMTVGQSIDQRTVQEIPLNGRHFVDLALLIPGTVTPPQNGFLTAPLRGQGSFAFNTAGNREDAVNFMINGINLNDMSQNQVTFQPTINTVSEFKVDNSTYSAEYGRNSGAIVNIATRSGTNQFHGELYDYLRNDFFDARNAFNRKTVVSNGATVANPIASFKRNQFGADFGGPIFRDKTFFFLSYEGLRQRQGLPFAANVLDDPTRAAILAGANPVAKALTNLLPAANGTLNNAPAFLGSGVAPVDIDQGTADISHKISDKDSLHGYWVYQRDLRIEAAQGTSIPSFGDTRQGHRQVLTLNETHVFSSNMVNEARIGANRILITFNPNNTTDPASLGLGSALGPNEQFMPTIVLNFLNGTTFGDERAFPQGRGDTTYVLADTLSWIRGRHSFKFGSEWRDFRNNNFNGDPGQLVYNSLASFQNDTPDTAARTVGSVANRIDQGALDFFAQDSFKFTQNLTLELGLRYAWNMSPTEAKDRFVTFDPATVSLKRVTEPYAQNNKNFQPRVGFAWDVFRNSNTILRGGYAYQTDEPITGFVTGLTSNPPFALPISVNTQSTVAQLTAAFNGTPSTISPAIVNPDFRDANVQSWNLNIQQQLGHDMALMVGYFGSKGTHLEVDRNLNQLITFGKPNPITPTPLVPNVPFFQLSPTDPFLPNVRLGNMTMRDSSSNSNYHGLWVTATKHMSHGLQFNGSYTWSHSIDDVSRNNNGIVLPNSLDLASGRGNSDFDVRHRVVVNAIYDLPFKGNRLVSGWEVATIVSAQTGNPFTIVVPGAGITGVGNTVTPIVNGPITISNNPLGQWIVPTGTALGNPSFANTFTIPTNTLGNMARNSIYGPGFSDADLSIVKNTKVTEKTNLQFRVDAFDLLNHPNYGQPSRILSAVSSANPKTIPALFTINSTRFPPGDSGSSRQLQMALKLQF
jgi:Carboxypeptidase regulatory-like domain